MLHVSVEYTLRSDRIYLCESTKNISVVVSVCSDGGDNDDDEKYDDGDDNGDDGGAAAADDDYNMAAFAVFIVTPDCPLDGDT